MDDYYRSFLTEKLSAIHDIDWKPLFLEMENELRHGNNKVNLEKEQKAKRKAINKYFSEDERYKKMFSAKLLSDILPEFVIHNDEGMVNSYDNTVLFTDFNVYHIIKAIDKPGYQSAFLMVSDSWCGPLICRYWQLFQRFHCHRKQSQTYPIEFSVPQNDSNSSHFPD